jgi:hypothetical protein
MPEMFNKTRKNFVFPLIPINPNVSPHKANNNGKKILTFNTPTCISFPQLVKPTISGKTAIKKKTPDIIEKFLFVILSPPLILLFKYNTNYFKFLKFPQDLIPQSGSFVE